MRIFLDLIDRLDRWGRRLLNVDCQPMRREDPAGGDTEIDRHEPEEYDLGDLPREWRTPRPVESGWDMIGGEG